VVKHFLFIQKLKAIKTITVKSNSSMSNGGKGAKYVWETLKPKKIFQSSSDDVLVCIKK